jgi:hypothetical protein
MTSKLPTETMPGQWCFKMVEALDESEAQLKVRFQGDTALLPVSSTAERWWELQVLSGSLRHGGAIAVLFGEDSRILDLGVIIIEEVRGVSQNPRYPQVTDVQFEGMGPPKHLWKEHPRYEELLRQITAAIATHPLIWCVLQGGTIVDVKVLSDEEDDLLWRWMREEGQRAEAARLENRCPR